MISFIEFIKESEAPTNQTSGVANPDAKPLKFKESTVTGKTCIVVDDDTYDKCRGGHKPFNRWANEIDDEDLRNRVREIRSKHGSVLLQNEKTGLIYEFK